jgi:molybdopterin-guanine dinucleotide biosynthesis protein A
VTAPCDSPLVGDDLVTRLASALTGYQADVAVAHDGERDHPVFLLLSRGLRADLEAFLRSGGRKIDLWFARHRVARADFSDRPEAFANINSADERLALEQRLTEHMA